MSLVKDIMFLVTIGVGAALAIQFTDFRSPAFKEIQDEYLERDVKKALAEHRERKRMAKDKDSDLAV